MYAANRKEHKQPSALPHIEQLEVGYHAGGAPAAFPQNPGLGKGSSLKYMAWGPWTFEQTLSSANKEEVGVALGAISAFDPPPILPGSTAILSKAYISVTCPDPGATHNHQVKLLFPQICKPLRTNWELSVLRVLASLLKARAQVLPKRHGLHVIYGGWMTCPHSFHTDERLEFVESKFTKVLGFPFMLPPFFEDPTHFFTEGVHGSGASWTKEKGSSPLDGLNLVLCVAASLTPTQMMDVWRRPAVEWWFSTDANRKENWAPLPSACWSLARMVPMEACNFLTAQCLLFPLPQHWLPLSSLGSWKIFLGVYLNFLDPILWWHALYLWALFFSSLVSDLHPVFWAERVGSGSSEGKLIERQPGQRKFEWGKERRGEGESEWLSIWLIFLCNIIQAHPSIQIGVGT